ncbi:hypothetical protein IRJ41_013488 [Triplophysa rosa]|uniref:Uncharacterized protein n=1 Tax=Triplophysa rosa TaxID=992332 RepID=A0A9W7WV39_TRIRA|nr:hypothetical protein IRJ41_013488 [Triplophysa rosa]
MFFSFPSLMEFEAHVSEFDLCVNELMISIYQLHIPAVFYFGTIRYYINLTTCMEMLGKYTCCTQVSFKHKILLEIHQIYFSLCSGLKDPDPYVLFLLIFPCIIITFITQLLFYNFRLYEKKVPKYY